MKNSAVHAEGDQSDGGGGFVIVVIFRQGTTKLIIMLAKEANFRYFPVSLKYYRGKTTDWSFECYHYIGIFPTLDLEVVKVFDNPYCK